MTNVIFLTFYYAIIFPAGFFFAAATLFVHYWTDKFCLLVSTLMCRQQMGTEFMRFDLIFELPACVVAGARGGHSIINLLQDLYHVIVSHIRGNVRLFHRGLPLR